MEKGVILFLPVHGYQEPFATASRWTVEMNEAWNSDIRLTIITIDGEAIELSTNQEKPGGSYPFHVKAEFLYVLYSIKKIHICFILENVK